LGFIIIIIKISSQMFLAQLELQSEGRKNNVASYPQTCWSCGARKPAIRQALALLLLLLSRSVVQSP